MKICNDWNAYRILRSSIMARPILTSILILRQNELYG